MRLLIHAATNSSPSQHEFLEYLRQPENLCDKRRASAYGLMAMTAFIGLSLCDDSQAVPQPALITEHIAIKLFI